MAPMSVQQAAQAAVQTLQQQWYGADSYASGTGLYHWDDPNFEKDAGGSFNASVIKTFGYTDPFQDTLRWWNSANAITAVIDYMIVTGTDDYLDNVQNTFVNAQNAYMFRKSFLATVAAWSAGAAGTAGATAGALAGAAACGLPCAILGGLLGGALGAFFGGVGGGLTAAATAARVYLKNFINPRTDDPPGLYDDEAWWALAWLRAYDLTVALGKSDDRYLAMAVVIFNDMTKGWDEVCDGGIYWSKDHTDDKDPPNGPNGPYKNAIANELFLALAAGLYRRLMMRPIKWVYFQGTANIFQAHANYLWVVTEFGSHQTWLGQQSLNSTPFVTPQGRVYFQGTDNRLLAINSDGTGFFWVGHDASSPQWTSSTPFIVPGDTRDTIYFRGKPTTGCSRSTATGLDLHSSETTPLATPRSSSMGGCTSREPPPGSGAISCGRSIPTAATCSRSGTTTLAPHRLSPLTGSGCISGATTTPCGR